MRKTFFAIIDTETTKDKKVVDFAIVVTDRHGNVYFTFSAMVKELYFDRANHPLFYTDENAFWAERNLPRRYRNYDRMIESGQRIVATIPAINRVIAEVVAKYNPIFTAYNWNYDFGVMNNTNIHTSIMEKNFCLWAAAAHKYIKTKAFRQFILDNHAFRPVTDKGNMAFITNAEVMARFVTNNPAMEDEPHTALEDALYYELPILKAVVNTKKKSDYMDAPACNWRKVQVRDWFKPK